MISEALTYNMHTFDSLFDSILDTHLISRSLIKSSRDHVHRNVLVYEISQHLANMTSLRHNPYVMVSKELAKEIPKVT